MIVIAKEGEVAQILGISVMYIPKYLYIKINRRKGGIVEYHRSIIRKI